MKFKWRLFYKGEKGEGIVSFLFLVLISLILMLISVSIYQAYTIQGNLQTACTETLQLMKVENGSDAATKTKFDSLLTKLGMNPRHVTYEATNKTVQRGDPLEVQASTVYPIFALRAVGVNTTVTLSAKATGFAHKYIRGKDEP